VNPYRRHYRTEQPLRFQSSVGDLVDEVSLYRKLKTERRPASDTPLKILLVWESAYNPERVLAFEELGHRLYGLWTDSGWNFNTVGPLPFGNVEEIPRAGWVESVTRLQPDIIYCLLNWQAVEFAHHVLENNPGIPFVWHYKEGPFIDKGLWPLLADLYTKSDGQIYCNPELLDWYDAALPGGVRPETSLVLNGDLPKQDWFTDARGSKLSALDGQPHTVVSGRPVGLTADVVSGLASRGINVHLYGNYRSEDAKSWVGQLKALAGDQIHVHESVPQDRWVEEFSKYDAGWLHYFQSKNGGEIGRAHWDDFNYPARIGTMAAAGTNDPMG
jgi:hypothetical protein